MTQGKKYLELLKGERGVRLVLVLGAVGMAMILLSGLFSSDQTESTSEITQTDQTATELESYCSALETELAEILAEIDGVGNCDVMVMAASTQETVYVKNSEQSESDTGQQSQESVVILDGSDGDHALVAQVMSPQVSGVLVVCTGASSSIVQERVVSAGQAVLDLPSNRICVAVSKE